MWKDAEMKDIIIKKVERTLKETAIDCTLNKNINYFDKRFKERADKDYTAECDYLKCEYKCYNSKPIKPENTDNSTMVESFIKEDIDLIIDKIIEIYNSKLYFRLNEIISLINSKNNIDNKLIFIALNKLIGKADEKYPLIFENKDEVKGYIIYRSGFYVFQPLNMWDNELPIVYRKYKKYNNELNVNIEKSKLNLEKQSGSVKNIQLSIDNILGKLSKIDDKYELSYYIDHNLNLEKKVYLVEYILKKFINNNFDKTNLNRTEILIIEYTNKYLFEENINRKLVIGHTLENIPKCYNNVNDEFVECELDVIRNIDFSYDFSKPDAKIIGYLESKNNEIKFKIIDNTEVRGKFRHDSKVAKNTLPTGKVCETYDKQSLEKFCKILGISTDKASRTQFCKAIEIEFRKFDDLEIDGKKWFYTVDEWNSKLKLDEDSKSNKVTIRKRNRRTKSNYKMKYKFDIKKLKKKKKTKK